MRGLRFCIALSLICLSLFGIVQASDKPLVARQGVLDLKSWRLDLHASVELVGDWLVYPQQLLTLEELSLLPIPPSQLFPVTPLDCDIPVMERARIHASQQSEPRTQNQSSQAGRADSSSVNRHCVATYVLELRNLPAQPLAIRITEIPTAFRLIWNDQLLAEGGVVSDDLKHFRPYSGHRIATIQSEGGRGVLILQVANLADADGAVHPLVLGDASSMRAAFAQGELIQALSAAIAGIGAILLLLQQKARRRYEKGLWGLALFSFATLVYTITEGYTVVSWFVAEPDWANIFRFNVASQHLFLPGLIIWLSSGYKQMFPPWYLILVRLQLLIVVPAVMLIPEPALIALESPQMLLNVALGMIAFAFLLRFRHQLVRLGEQFLQRGLVAQSGAGTDRDESVHVQGAGPDVARLRRQLNALIISFLIVLVSAIHDVMLYQTLIPGTNWLPIGFVCFIVGQIFLLAVQRARQHAYLEGINQQVLAEQQKLEEQVEQCTQALNDKVAQLKEMGAELHYLERHDGLTGLLRQNSFLAECRQMLAGAGSSMDTVSLILLDMDRYKQIGAMFGPQAADQAMKDIASLLNKWAEKNRLCGRLEGESFALLVPDMDEATALHEAEWLKLRISQRSVMEDELADNGREFHITASFGVYSCLVAEADIQSMMDAAESALNRAKANGRNCAVGYSQLSHDAPVVRPV